MAENSKPDTSNPMTQNDKLEIIKQKCIAANPEIGTARAHWPFEREIRLADVLLAVDVFRNGKNEHGYSVRHTGRIYEDDLNSVAKKQVGVWNLRADDLQEQSPETIEFLYSLLK